MTPPPPLVLSPDVDTHRCRARGVVGDDRRARRAGRADHHRLPGARRARRAGDPDRRAGPGGPRAAARRPHPVAGGPSVPRGGAGPRCAAPVPTADGGQVISCTLVQPATGSTTTFAFDLQVDGPGQTADMVLFRGAVEEARFTAPIDLTQFESGLSVRYGTEPWTVGDGPGTGTLSVSVAQAAAWDVSGAVLSIEVTGGVLPRST